MDERKKPPPLPPPGDPVWPGAVEAGLQSLPDVAPGGPIRLDEPEQQTWMNQNAAAHEKGAPLTKAELQRVYTGKDWKRRRRAAEREG